VFPRSILQISSSNLFVVTDMGAGWSPGRGRLLLLDPSGSEAKRIRQLPTKLDLPHGLALGIDGRIYARTMMACSTSIR